MLGHFFEDIESFSRYSNKSTGKGIDGFNEDLFLPKSQIASEKFIPQKLFTFFCILIYLGMFVLIIRLSNLQIVNGQQNLVYSENNRIRKERIKPQRGLIKDRQGNIIARNLPTFSIIFNPQFCPSGCRIDALKRLNNYEEINERFEKNLKTKEPIVLVSELSRDEILSLGNLDAYAYLQVESSQLRSYPYGSLFSHVIGYLGESSEEDLSKRDDLFLGDKVGQSGIEKIYDRVLQGEAGYELIEVDAAESLRRFISRKDPVSGQSLILTISKDLQETADTALNEAEKLAKACCGAIIVQDLRTGALLSLISHPAFDTNVFSDKEREEEIKVLFFDKNQPFFNRAVSGVFPPGSIFKVVVAAAALEEKIIDRDTFINAPESLSLGTFTFGDWKEGGHGVINIVDALAQSADTFFYQIGGGFEGRKGLGPKMIAKYARLFGLGSPADIDLPEEASGLVPDPDWKKLVKGEDWYVGNTYHYSIGQGDLLATPLQITQATAAIANGGVLYKPYILSEIVDESGVEVFRNRPLIIREKFVGENSLIVVREGMRQAAEAGGTAWPFFNFRIKVGAKTGTAEAADAAFGKATPHAWITVFAPFDNPEVAVTVLVENGGQGSDVAGPVARKILEKYFEGR